MNKVEWDFDFSQPLRDPTYTPPPIPDHADWLVDLYTHILKVEKISKNRPRLTELASKIKCRPGARGNIRLF